MNMEISQDRLNILKIIQIPEMLADKDNRYKISIQGTKLILFLIDVIDIIAANFLFYYSHDLHIFYISL